MKRNWIENIHESKWNFVWVELLTVIIPLSLNHRYIFRCLVHWLKHVEPWSCHCYIQNLHEIFHLDVSSIILINLLLSFFGFSIQFHWKHGQHWNVVFVSFFWIQICWFFFIYFGGICNTQLDFDCYTNPIMDSSRS